MAKETSQIKNFKIKEQDYVLKKCYGFGVRHLQMACMCFCIISLFIGRGCMSVAILAMTDKERSNDGNITIYDWDKKTQSIILSSFFWGYMVMQIPGGMLARRFGGKPIILSALIANGTLCLLLPLIASVGGWQTVCVARVAMGLTQACLYPSIHTLLGRWLPAQERTKFTGIVYGGVQLGTIAAMPVSGLLADTAIGWKLIYYSIAGLMYLTSLVWYFCTASSPGEHRLITDDEIYYIEKTLNTSNTQRTLRTPWTHIVKTKALWAIMAAHIASGVSFVLFFVDLPTYLERGLGLSLKNSATLSALPFIGMWVGSVGSSSISEWIYNKGFLSTIACRKIFNSFALFGMASGLIGLSFLGPENKNLAIVALVGAMLMSGCMTAGYMVNQLDLSPNFAGVMLGMTNTVCTIGSVFAPIVTSYVLRNDPTDVDRWHVVFLGFAGMNIFCNILYLIFGSADRQEWDDPNFLDRLKSDPEEMKEFKPKPNTEKNVMDT